MSSIKLTKAFQSHNQAYSQTRKDVKKSLVQDRLLYVDEPQLDALIRKIPVAFKSETSKKER